MKNMTRFEIISGILLIISGAANVFMRVSFDKKYAQAYGVCKALELENDGLKKSFTPSDSSRLYCTGVVKIPGVAE